MNVSKLARQLNVSTKELLEKLPELGFAIGARAIKVDDSQVDKILMAWKQRSKLMAIKRQNEAVTEIRGQVAANLEQKKTLALGATIVVKDLAEKVNMPLSKVMGEMMRNGIMASLNERLDFETASIIAEDLGFKVTRLEAEEIEHVQSKKEELEALMVDRTKASIRPPVVVVMGHVDHGKTKLLDAIRKTNLVAGEAGGITQHIGAYQTVVKKDKEERLITFLDTPGHEAFKTMRSRGGQIADVAVLVVAADDGIKPQTLESLAIIQKENLPFIVAINKIDKEGADIERVKKELTEINLTPEDWGGKTICVPISALQGKGLDELLEMILLVADIGDLTSDEAGQALATVIESHMDKNEGPVATVLVQAGTLKVNDLITVGAITGKVKALKTWKGESIDHATPGTPAKLLGLKAVPQSGDILHVTTDIKEFRKQAKNMPSDHGNNQKAAHGINNASDNNDQNIPTLNLVIKADVLGSLEAIEESLNKLNSDKARIKIVKQALGFVTESDVQAAEAANAILIAFHLTSSRQMTMKIAEKKIRFYQFDIIYKLLERLEVELKNLERPDIVRTLIGKLKVLAVFKVIKKETILGGAVTEGMVKNPCKVKVLRNNEIITFGDLTDLESNKEKMTEVVAGNQVGMRFLGEPVIQKDDILEFFTESDVAKN